MRSAYDANRDPVLGIAKVYVEGPRLGINRECRLLVRGQRRRLGQLRTPTGPCASTGAVMMLKPPLLQYVVVHELAHLVHADHSRAFWALVNGAIPDAARRRRDLKEAGRHLTLRG
ncbi:MAG: M48 family metallopeptidase [Gemmatimonadota bacterium]|nr:M48 family metallopeptidase [Gemmatimonadota bacterium]